jgi:hypothetical protein
LNSKILLHKLRKTWRAIHIFVCENSKSRNSRKSSEGFSGVFWALDCLSVCPSVGLPACLPVHLYASQAKSGQIRPNQAKSGQIRPNQAKSGQIRPNQAKSGQIKPTNQPANQAKRSEAKSI